jgi:CheY-like chemotaxis protein
MADFSNHIILIVDDEPDNLEVFRAAFEMLHNSTVKTASSGAEALAILATTHPTVIVTDLSMPKMDGYALLRQLRQRTDIVGLPIIAITAHAMKGDRERILASGFDGYISKPFDISTLADELDNCLKAFTVKLATPAIPKTGPIRTNGAPHAA